MCNGNPGVLVVVARGKTWKRAQAHALNELQGAGDAGCAGGAADCVNGAPCEWKMQSVSFTFEFDQEHPQRPIVCTATGSGTCECA
jgi:hypothetical protein